jgi:class 3 adenylate cyclase/tetratricopeptide (TPR) repeat protein
MELPTGDVTFLLTDIVGSTRLWEAAPAAMAAALPRHDHLIEEAVANHGGTVLKQRCEGDSTFSVFHRPSDAAAAALAAQDALAVEPWPPEAAIGVRMAIHTGRTLERGGDYYGREVNRTARLRGVAQKAQILVTEAVAEVVRYQLPTGAELITLGSWSLRDVAEPEHVYRLQRRSSAASDTDPSGRARTDRAGVPLPARLGSARTDRFVGRDDELDLLWQRSVEVTGGARRVVMVSGDPGIGKTHLVAELGRRAHASGSAVLYGRCDEGLGLPYQPFVEALRHYVEHAPQPVLDAFVSRHGGHLVRLVPQLAQRVSGLPVADTSDPETARYLLFEAVVGLLASASTDTAVVLVLDDLHWADRNTLLLIRHVVQAADPMRLLVVGTYRETEVTPDHPLASLLGAIRREAAFDRVSLTGLTQDDIAALVGALAGRRLEGEERGLAPWVWTESGGNPFFAYEILRHLVESKAIRRVDGRWMLATDVSLLRTPESVRNILRVRVAHLGDEVGRVLTAAAVIGREFDADLVAAVLEDDEDVVLDALEQAIQARLLTEVPSFPGRFTFAHALIVHALYDSLTVTRRARLHRRVAQAMESRCADDPGERLPELAGHWLATHVPTEIARTIHYARQAGDQALDGLAPHEAAGWYERALALVGNPRQAQAERCELTIALGVAQRQAGDLRFRSTLLDAAAQARKLGDTDALVRAALANNRGDVSTAGEVDAERLDVLDAALAAIDPSDSPARARLLAVMALESNYAGDWERRQTMADEALAIARRLDDPETLAAVFTLRHEAIRLPHTLEERLANTAEHLEVAARLGDPLQQAFAAHWRVRACWEAGDIGEVDRWMAVVDELGDLNRYLKWNASAQWSYRLLLDGRMDEAEERTYEAFQVGQSTGERDAPTVLTAQLVNVRWDQGRLAEIEPMLQRAVEDNPGIPAFRAVLAQAYCELDRFDDARTLFERDAVAHFGAYLYDCTWLCSAVLLADVCAQLGDASRASELYQRLAPWRDQVAFSGASVYGSVAHYLGQLAASARRYDTAEVDFKEAARRHEEMGATTFLARTQLAWARMLDQRGESQDRLRAEMLATEAQRTAGRVGARTVERRAWALQREIYRP